MAAVHLWKRGSKKRVAQIRWKRGELLHALIMTLLMAGFALWVAMWVATRHFD
jgi:Co/Zn/Cd efflux system component